ncbi:DNA-directed DNA/RNA polymerase mu [Bienertia sinuspersici]
MLMAKRKEKASSTVDEARIHKIGRDVKQKKVIVNDQGVVGNNEDAIQKECIGPLTPLKLRQSPQQLVSLLSGIKACPSLLISAPLDDNWRRSFLVLAVNTTTYDTSRISEFNWCLYTLESLAQWSLYWNRDKRRCFPLVSAWDCKSLEDRIELEMTLGFGNGVVLDRIEAPKVPLFVIPHELLNDGQNQPAPLPCHHQIQTQNEEIEDHPITPSHMESTTTLEEYNNKLKEATEAVANAFVRLSNVLKVGGQFYLESLTKNNMIYNDIELFTSDWFGDMIDDAVRNALGEEEILKDQEPHLQPNPVDQSSNFDLNLKVGGSCTSTVQDMVYENMNYDVFDTDQDEEANLDEFSSILMCISSILTTKKSPAIFKSPYLTKYSHLIDENDEGNNFLCDFAFSTELSKIIDAWVSILTKRSIVNSGQRIFFPNAAFNLLCMNDGYDDSSQDMILELRINSFVETIKQFMEENCIESIAGFNLIFFPVYDANKYYVMCVNMKSKTLDILDNRILEKGVPLENRYQGYPQSLLEAYAFFLNKNVSKKPKDVKKFKVRVVEMPWRNNENDMDSGIYTMRHMETFHGKIRWNCGLSPNNFEYLTKLRMWYCVELLTHDSNRKKAELRF